MTRSIIVLFLLAAASAVAADAAQQRPEPPGIPISFTMPHDGFATIAINDVNGARVRNLIAETPLEKGPNTVTWDGLDDDGHLASPGTYAWKGLVRGPIHLAYQFSVNTPNSPSWHTPDTSGAWLADHSPPLCAFALGDVVFLSSPGPEANHGLIAVDLDGKKLWGWRHGMSDSPTQMTTDGKHLICLSDQGTAWLYRFELTDGGRAKGRQVPFAGKDAFHKLSQYDLGAYRPHTHGMAYKDGKLYVSHTHVDSVLELDAETADVLRTLNVPQPRGLATGPDGNIYVAAGNDVAVLDLADGSLRRIAAGLGNIRSIAFGPDGRLFVGDNTACQVRVFANEAGKWTEQLKIGEAGGRGLGPYNPAAMNSTYGLTVDKLGRVWVAEAGFHPKRVSLWNGGTGELIEEFIGPPLYGGGGCIDPLDRTRFVYNGVEFLLDWDAGTARPLNVLQQVPQPLQYSETRFDGRGFPARIAYHGEARLLVNSSQWLGFVMVSAIENGIARPLSMAWHTSPPSALKVWTDLNGDGLATDDEVQQTEPLMRTETRGCWGLSLAYARDYSLHVNYCGGIWRLPAGEWNEHGAPTYDVARLERLATSVEAKGAPGGVDAAGNTILGAPLHSISPSGRINWRYPMDWVGVHGSHNAPMPAPGRIIGALDLIGFADIGRDIGETFAFSGNLGQQFLMTADGLFIASLFKDYRDKPDALPPVSRRGILLDNTCIGPEPFFQSYQKTSDGKVYVVCGRADSKIVELQGLETMRRIFGSLDVTPEHLAGCAQTLRELAGVAAAQHRERGTRRYVIRRTTTPIPVDIPPWQEGPYWPEEKPMTLGIPGGQVSVRLAYDDQFIYVRADGTHAFPTMFQNDPALLENKPSSLAGLELCIASPSYNDEKPADGAVAMSLHITQLFDRKHGGIIRAGSTAAGAIFVEGGSSAGRAKPLDALRDPQPQPGGAEVQMIEQQAWPHDPAHLRLRARIPLRDLKIDATPGEPLLGDVGVVFSHRGDGRRRYWSDAAGCVVQDERLASAKLNAARWGQFVFGERPAGARAEYTIMTAPRTIAADGNLADWAGVPVAVLPENVAAVRACRTPDALHVAWEVKDDSPFANTGNDWTLLFKSGDCVDIQLAAPSEPATPQRLLFSMFEGKPIAVLYRPTAGLPDPENAEIFTNVNMKSPVGEVAFAAVCRLAAPKIGVVRTDAGYVVEATIPWKQLGFAPPSDAEIRGDFGVLLSTADGSAVARRIYWANPSTSIVSDLPSEARLTPDNWGLFKFPKR